MGLSAFVVLSGSNNRNSHKGPLVVRVVLHMATRNRRGSRGVVVFALGVEVVTAVAPPKLNPVDGADVVLVAMAVAG